MINFEQELNSEQLEVVKNGDGSCLVLAGAGSGKTRTITYRVAHLIEKGVDPKNILLVTFTNRAAKEMMLRVQNITEGKIKLTWSGTFHHIAYRILRQYAPILGYKNNFSILDSQDSTDLIKLCLKTEGVEKGKKKFPSPAVINSIISYARNSGLSLKDVLETKYSNWIDIESTIIRIADEYRKKKIEANAMDFDDLLVNLYLLLLKSESVRQKYATQFQYVLVDEYQDTNKIQASIIKLLASVHKNILVVGDDAQSIYSFRAADIKNILDFERDYPDAKIFRLEINYRSTPDILGLANDVISYNKKQYQKELKSILSQFSRPELQAFADNQEEADFIADTILELNADGVPLNKIAVLFRAAFHSQILEMSLAKRGISYDFRGGVRFFERAHIKDVLCYLRIYSNNNDSMAWSRILNMQVGIGPVAAQRIIGEIGDIKEKVESKKLKEFIDLLPARAKIGFSEFLQIYEKLEKSDGSPVDLITAILDSKYLEYLEAEYPDYRERVEDIKQLAVFAEKQDDLAKFLAEATMQEGYTASKNQTANNEDKIVLSTIHQAKGLEWQAVFVMNLSAGQFPNERATKEENGLEEERRLFYVAITRAQKYLYLTYPLFGHVSSYLQGPSIFVEEINKELVVETGGGINIGNSFFDPSDDVDDVVYETLDEDKPRKYSFLKSIDEL